MKQIKNITRAAMCDALTAAGVVLHPCNTSDIAPDDPAIAFYYIPTNELEYLVECYAHTETTETETVTIAPAEMACVWDENGETITPDTDEEKEEVNTMKYTITRNEAFNSLEISFDGKPSEAVRGALKALKFRWHRAKGIWYGFASIEAVEAAINGQTITTTDTTPKAAKPAPADKPAAQDHIKIYYNGIKVDGKLIRCFYSLNNDCTVKGECVSISARDYADLPRDLLPVHNDTDIYTDYFDNDRATLTPDHPLYKYFRFAAMKARARDAKTYCDKLQKDLDAGKGHEWKGRRDYWRGEIETHKVYIDAYNAETDPGQPTAVDLAAIETRRIEAENARRAAEHEAELKEREHVLNMKNDGRCLIETAAAEYPIDDAAPVVTIRWSEHPAFYHLEDDALKLSIPAANRVFQFLDLKAHNDPDHGYYKTAFRITGTDPDGEPINYEGRYDIGDGEGTLLQHIRNLAEWELRHDQFGHEKPEPDETNDRLEFADYLERFTA